MPARDFLDSLKSIDRARLLAILERVAEHGVLGLNNDRIFKQEREFWAAKKDHCKGGPKGRNMIRLVAFLKRDRLILTHGFWKPPKGPWPEKEFITAGETRDEINVREKLEEQKGKHHG